MYQGALYVVLCILCRAESAQIIAQNQEPNIDIYTPEKRVRLGWAWVH